MMSTTTATTQTTNTGGLGASFWNLITDFAHSFIRIIIALFAGYLAFRCHNRVELIPRIIMILFAMYFGFSYLLYFLIIHVMFGIPCHTLI